VHSQGVMKATALGSDDAVGPFDLLVGIEQCGGVLRAVLSDVNPPLKHLVGAPHQVGLLVVVTVAVLNHGASHGRFDLIKLVGMSHKGGHHQNSC